MAFIKIIAYILLIVILLLLFILSVLLFSPIKYFVEGEYNSNKEEISGQLTWIFGIFRMKYSLENGLEKYLFFYNLDDSKEKKPKKKKSKKSKKEKGSKEKDNKNKVKDIEKDKNFPKKEKNKEEKSSSLHKEESKIDISKKPEKRVDKKKKQREVKKEKKISFIEKIKKKYKEIKKKISKFITDIKSIPKMWEEYQVSLLISLTKTLIKKLWKALGIKKYYFGGILGFEDPADTGEALGFVYAICGFLGLPVNLKGNFNEEELNIDGHIKGKTNVFKIAYPLVKYILEEPVMRVYQEF